MPLVMADHLHITLSRKPILRAVTFALQPGTLVGLIGPNGSGKTTLLRAISGLVQYKGSLKLRGTEVRAWKARALAREIAFVRQSVQLLFDFTVQELVLLGLSPHKKLLESTSSDDRARVERALAQVDLAGFGARSMLSLSGGERQRAYLAQALAQDAQLLLLDEPTTHLDVHHQHGFLQLILGLVAAGRSALAVFHDIEMAAHFCTHLLVLDGGRLIAVGKPDEVITESVLASVFRMRTQITYNHGGTLRIAFGLPLDST